MTPPDAFKRAAASRALDFVEHGHRLGLGTGSTAAIFVDLVAERVRAGLNVVCVPTSEATRAQAERLGLPLSTLDETPELDLTVDGADEIGPGLVLIKGGGGALLYEKIVAAASARMIVIADASKSVPVLGRFPLPVEVMPFGLGATVRAVGAVARRLGLAGEITLRRRDGATMITDGGHHILDCAFGAIPDPVQLARDLDAVPGVVEHGLFVGLATHAIIAGPSGIAEQSIDRPQN